MKIAIVGAGLAGCTMASLLKNKHQIVIFEQKNFIGGNCYDEVKYGCLVHCFGTHIFHTNDNEVYDYINNFTQMERFELRVKARTSEGIIPIPYNVISEKIIGRHLSDDEIKLLIFKSYSEKQWGISFDKLPKEITDRVPLRRYNTDCNYFSDKYQCMPKYGYTEMFYKMISGCTLNLNETLVDFADYDLVIWTGMIDAYFNYIYGKLKYRSLTHIHELTKLKRDVVVINECTHENKYTRSYDNSWFDLIHDLDHTVISYEYSCDYDGKNTPIYPMNWGVNKDLYDKYKKIDAKNIIFVGRLAEYKYYNMDQIIRRCLDISKGIK